MPAMRFGVLTLYNVSGLSSLLSCATFAAGSGLNADYKNSLGAQGPPSGMGVTKAHFFLQRECGLYSNPRGKSIAHIDRGASGYRGVLQFSFWPCPARLWRLLTSKLAAAKGEQVEKYITLFPFSVFSVSLW